MQTMIFVFFILNSFIAISMDAPSRRSSSSGRSNTLLARHHKRNSSLGQNVLCALHLKTEDCSSTIEALVTARFSEQNLSQESSRNLIDRAAENNRNQFTKMKLLAFGAIRNIKAENDNAHKEYLSHIKYAEHYYTSWMSLEITKDPRALDYMVQEEFEPLRETFNEKMASIVIQKK
jgi:hypothetical protein